MSTFSESRSLQGLQIGLSGAVPERQHWTEPGMDRSILEFVASFGRAVLERGGRLIHGGHPSFTPVLLEQVRASEQADRHPLTLFVSELWPETLTEYRRLGVQNLAEIVAVPKVGTGEVTDAPTRNASLTALRRQLVTPMDMMVAVGGLLHQGSMFAPGVLEELNLARERGAFCIVVGGLGGMAASYAEDSSDPGLVCINTRDIGHCVDEVILMMERRVKSAG